MNRRTEIGEIGAATTGAGAAVLAAAASICCVPIVAPLIISVFGVGGAVWAAGLRPYSWAILAAAGLLLGYAFRVTRSSRTSVPAGAACDAPGTRRRAVRAVLWSALVLWAGALLLNLAEANAVFAAEPKEYQVVDPDLEPFRSDFNAASDRVRAVLLVGPT